MAVSITVVRGAASLRFRKIHNSLEGEIYLSTPSSRSSERINLKFFNELLFFFFPFLSSREIWIRWNSNLFPFERLVVRSFSGITIRKTTPCKVESVDIDRRLKFRIVDVKRPSRIEFDQYRRARDLLKGDFIYIYFFVCL